MISPTGTLPGGRNGRLRVGVTLFIREGAQSIWENGIFQNCFFLAMLLARAPSVEHCVIVNGGPGSPQRAGDFLATAPCPVVDMAAAMNDLDVIIELSAQLAPDWARAFAERGGRIVGMRVANDFVIDAERMVHGLDPGLLMSGVPYDEIWTLPAFAKTCSSYYRTGFRAPVRIMRHLWSPILLERALSDRDVGRAFEYAPGRRRWRLAIMEPNICTVKTCHLPLLLCDVAHRMDARAIEMVRVFGALALKDQPGFVAFARSMEIVRQGLATFEARHPIYDVMGPIADALVSHHWENAQNYIYYEALHGGFPLVHNSALLGDCGYAYRDFDPEDGALTLLQALHEHDRDLENYRLRARRFLRTLDPLDDTNVAAYDDALRGLFEARSAA